MFSTRLCKLTRFLFKLCHHFSVSSGHFDQKSKTFHREESLENRIRWRYNLAVVWCISAFFLVVKYYKNGDVDRYNVTLAYYIAGDLATIGSAVIPYNPHDISLAFNTFYNLMHYMHRKQKQKFLILMFY